MFFRKIKEAVKEVADELEKGLNEISRPHEATLEDETEELPVKCTIGIRSQRYSRLSMQKRVEVSSKKEYEQMKKGMLMDAFRAQFGLFTTMSGKSINVWTDKCFNQVKKAIVFDDENLVAALKKHGKW